MLKTFFSLHVCFLIFFCSNGFQPRCGSAPKPNKRDKYYPLWKHIQKLSRCECGGSWEWQCNLCSNSYKRSYPRVKAHFFNGGQGVVGCPKIADPMVRRPYQRWARWGWSTWKRAELQNSWMSKGEKTLIWEWLSTSLCVVSCHSLLSDLLIDKLW